MGAVTLCPPRKDAMKDLRACSIELAGDQLRFLEEMVALYSLPDVGKAVRCLVNYTRETSDRRDDIFTEVRCLDC